MQDLQTGDVISTPSGETTVKWLGQQIMAPWFQHPDKINPVCITAGALADGVPTRDLFVSQGHAAEVDGLLINASALVNGRSIYMVADMPLDGFSYYHIETGAHEVILAERCGTESYLDMPNRDAFVNGAERADAALITEMDRPRITAARLVPPELHARLKARAGLQTVHRAA